MSDNMSIIVNDLPLYVILNFDLDSIDGQAIVFPDKGCDYLLVRSSTQEGYNILQSSDYRILTFCIICNFHYILIKKY